MSRLVKLFFSCTVRCNPEYSDVLGYDIASDLLMLMDNGVDYLDWEFIKSEVI